MVGSGSGIRDKTSRIRNTVARYANNAQIFVQETERELRRCEEEWTRRIKEVEEEGRLGREEIELRYRYLLVGTYYTGTGTLY
jgi:hypothetical protein